jgi:hypothetical protein
MTAWDPDQLWLKAKAYFDRASAVGQSSFDFPFWSALGLELLARAALTSIHPVLNADPREDVNVLYGCGFEIASQPRSLPAHSVYLRLEKTVENFGKAQRELCDFLGLLRNQELHTGHLPFDNLRESKWLPRFYEVCKILTESMGKTLEELFGIETANSARQLIQTLTEDIQGKVKGRLGAHAKVFADKTPEEQNALLLEAKAALLELERATKRERCPACPGDGLLAGNLIKERPPVYLDGTLYVEGEYLAKQFRCFVCQLVLRNVEEIVAAGVEPRFTDRRETSLHELYEPDYYDEYDNM